MSHTNQKSAGADSTRPYERCERFGPSVLTDAELLAVILRTGMPGRDAVALAKDIIAATGGIAEIVGMTPRQLCAHAGVGRVRAIQLQCIGEMAARIARDRVAKDPVFDEPGKAAGYYMEQMRRLPQEQLLAVFLNNRLRLMRETVLSMGTADTSVITPREILREALRYGAVNLLLLHNHPGGDPEPSGDDILLTRRVRDASDIVGIRFADHIVIGDGCYVSFRERGLL